MANTGEKECLVEEWNTSTHSAVFERICESLNYRKVDVLVNKKVGHMMLTGICMITIIPRIILCVMRGDVRKLMFRGLNIGYSVNETVISFSEMARFRFDFLGFKWIYGAINLVLDLEKRFKENRVALVMGGDDVYVKMSIASQLATKYGIDCLYLKGYTRIGVFRYNPVCMNSFPEYEHLGDLLDDNDENDKKMMVEVESEMVKRVSGNRGSLGYMPVVECLSDSDEMVKGAVWIFLHDFYDAPGIYNGNIFKSHVDWVLITVRMLTRLGAKIVIKRHPNERLKNNKVIEYLKDKFGSAVYWMDKDVDVEKIRDSAAKCILTVQGSVIPEANYAGIPVICAGRNPYIGFDTAYRAKSRKEYFDLLSSAVSSSGLAAKPKTESVRACTALKKYYESVKKVEIPFDDIDENTWNLCGLGNYPDNIYERRSRYLNSLVVKENVSKRLRNMDLIGGLGITDMIFRDDEKSEILVS